MSNQRLIQLKLTSVDVNVQLLWAYYNRLMVHTLR